MHSIFLTDEELSSLKGNRLDYPFSDISRRLIENCKKTLERVNFARLSSSGNLFIIQNALLEATVACLLPGPEKHIGLNCVRYSLSSILNNGWRSLRLVEEIHRAFVLNGLCVVLDQLKYELTTAEIAELKNTIACIAESLWEDYHVEAWGETVKKRNAWNHTIVPISAIGNAGLVLEEHKLSKEWVNLAIYRTGLFFDDGLTSQGMTREGLAYCGFVFRNLGLFLRGLSNTRKAQFLSPNNPYYKKLQNTILWYAAELFPGGSFFQNYNDSYWDPHQAMQGFLMMFKPLKDSVGHKVWEWSVGTEGLSTFGQDPDLRLSSLFESAIWHPGGNYGNIEHISGSPFYCSEHGYLVDRNNWSARGTVFTFNCGEYIGAIHDQSDNGSFTLILNGTPIIIDSGAANKPTEGSASSSYGHNLVLIDGQGQRPSGAGHGVSGTITACQIQNEFTYVAADLSPSYNSQDYNVVQHAKRHCIFVKSELTPYLLVLDDIQKDFKPHIYEFLIHTPKGLFDLEEVKPSENVRRLTGAYATIATTNVGTWTRRDFHSANQRPFESHDVWSYQVKAVNPCFVHIFSNHLKQDPIVSENDKEFIIKVVHSCSEIDTITLPKSFQDGKLEFSPFKQSRSNQVKMQTVEKQNSNNNYSYKDLSINPTEICPKGEVDVIKSIAPELRIEPGKDLLEDGTQILLKMASALERANSDPNYPTPPSTGVVMAAAAAQSTFKKIGLEFFDYFIRYGGLKPTDRVLDVGCGGGRMAIPLTYFLAGGSYIGFDVHENSIRWCKDNVKCESAQFRFEHLNLINDLYNSKGSYSVTDFKLPFQDAEFSFSIVTSVFTHMVLDEVSHYLSELYRTTEQGGTVFCTAYLINPQSHAAMLQNLGAVQFPFAYKGSLIHMKERPLQAIAHHEEDFRFLIRKAGFIIDKCLYGFWSGCKSSTTKQDILIIKKS